MASLAALSAAVGGVPSPIGSTCRAAPVGFEEAAPRRLQAEHYSSAGIVVGIAPISTSTFALGAGLASPNMPAIRVRWFIPMAALSPVADTSEATL